jgi:hypothetical protein
MDEIVMGVYFVSVVIFFVLAIVDLYKTKQFQISFAPPVATAPGACPTSCMNFPGYGCGYLSNNILFECPSNCCS